MSTGTDWKRYRRNGMAEMRPYVIGEALGTISISQPDKDAGSPKVGDMIARNPENHRDVWLVAAAYFAANFDPVPIEIGSYSNKRF
jgi:hypothetical protein